MSGTSHSNVDMGRGFGVLIIAKVTQGAAAGYATYLDGKAQPTQLGDYYLKDGERIEAPGRWVQGADEFGTDPAASVTGEQLRTLMAVRRPDTGRELRSAGGSGEAVAAIDATFSAPKSVSAVWALAGHGMRERIEQAHETAIDRAITYAVAQVPMLRRRVGQDTVVHEKATGVIATSWRHTTARAVDDQVPDPQLHSHVLLHGAIRRDGRVVAIDSRSWLTHQREVGAAYRTELARELSTLGYTITRGTGRGRRYFELDGIPQPLIDRWSSRHHQVQAAIRQRLDDQERNLTATVSAGGPAAVDAARQLQALRDSGQLSPGQERLMGTVTRSAKLPVTAKDLDRAWQHAASEHHFHSGHAEDLVKETATAFLVADAGQVIAGLTEYDATFPARDARAIALERSAGAPIDDALQQLKSLRDADEIVLLADGSGTTREHRGKERTVVAITRRLTEIRLTPLPAELAEREADHLDRELAERGGGLSDEQRAAIHLACGPHPLVIIEGHAGTGKSTALTGIARAHQNRGQDILVTSTAALAAERLATDLRDGGVDTQAFSTAALTAAIRHDRVTLGPTTTIIHDEAALASTQEQLELFNAVEASGARLIAVGDPQQNQPVGAGGLWHDLQTRVRDAGAHGELTINQRAHDPADQRDQALFRDQHAERAIRGYAARDRVHFQPDDQRAEDRALEAAQRDRKAGKTTIVITQTSNDHLDTLNARAQAIRRQAGELGEDGIPIPGRPYDVHEGDAVQFRHTITHHPDHDTIRNGTPAQVIGVDPAGEELQLRLEDGRDTTLDREDLADGDLRLAYVAHPFPAQGTTTDTTHLIATDHTTREGTYVGLTRAREATHIYARAGASGENDTQDRLTALVEHLSRAEPAMSSLNVELSRSDDTVASAALHTPRPHLGRLKPIPDGQIEQLPLTKIGEEDTTQRWLPARPMRGDDRLPPEITRDEDSLDFEL